MAERGRAILAPTHSVPLNESLAMHRNRDVYCSFLELFEREKEGVDYRIVSRRGLSRVAVLAPHGGGIEPGTTEIANAVASRDHGFYSFEGLKRTGNARLHITSSRFDEPHGVSVAVQGESVIVIHGCEGNASVVYLGGLDSSLKERIREDLERAGFETGSHEDFQGTYSDNICNRGKHGHGVQLELTQGLRREMFANLTREGRKNPSDVFRRFVSALREAIQNGSSGPSSRRLD